MAALLKNIYDTRFFNDLILAIEPVLPKFEKKKFMTLIRDAGWEQRELKQRMKHIAMVLHQFLTNDFENNTLVIFKIIQQAIKNKVRVQSLEYMFLPEYIALFGIEHFKVSMKAIEFITQFASCEFAIRPFLIKYPEKTMKQMLLWSKHESHLVRRFSSEGSRPRLPWGSGAPFLKENPAPVLPILENLKNDPSEFVRRSVANNLNDIARDHPAIVLEMATRWKGLSKQTDWIIKHGCRTLLKKADKETLALWGLSHSHGCMVFNLSVKSGKIQVGDHLEFSFDMVNNEDQPVRLRIEYGIDYIKANSKQARKLFKITENVYESNRTYGFKRKQSFSDMTTRKHYAGKHRLAIVVNGTEMASAEFTLEKQKGIKLS